MRKEAGEGIFDAPLERQAAHVDRIGAVAVRILGADENEALLLVEAGDGVAGEAPRVAPLLAGAVGELALPFQPLGQEPVLSGGWPHHLPVGQDHTAKAGSELKQVRPPTAATHPK
ncbi:hypothetical protein [Methylobacterium oxalidis]|uniref:hypothetical protein n=1 Tax=Methylobacterium oxalidis TaxID=944322 RepID=UPI0033164A3F